MQLFSTVFLFSIFSSVICLYHKLDKNAPPKMLKEVKRKHHSNVNDQVKIARHKKRCAETLDESEMTQIDLASFLQPEEETDNEDTQYSSLDEYKDKNSAETLISDEFEEGKNVPDHFIESNYVENLDENINGAGSSHYKGKVRRSNDKGSSYENIVRDKYSNEDDSPGDQRNVLAMADGYRRKSSEGTKRFRFPFFFHEIDKSVPGGFKNEPVFYCKWCRKEPVAVRNNVGKSEGRHKRSFRGLCRKCREALMGSGAATRDQIHNTRDYFRHMSRLASAMNQKAINNSLVFNTQQKMQQLNFKNDNNHLLSIISEIEKKVDKVTIPGFFVLTEKP